MEDRKVDDAGRVVLPFAAREALGIKSGDSVSFTIERDAIIIKKGGPAET